MSKNPFPLLFFFFLIILMCSFTLSSNHGKKSFVQTGQQTDLKALHAKSDTITFDNFELIEGLEVSYLRKPYMRFIQLSEGSIKGIAQTFLFDQSGKYNLTFSYYDGLKGKSSIEIFINGRRTGGIIFGTSNSPGEHIIKGVDIQQWSPIRLEFSGDGNEKCSLQKIILTPAGNFTGKEEKLEKPVTLKVFETEKERREGRQMLGDFVGSRIDSLMKERLSELANLKTPAEWKSRQQKTRDRLPEFFGKFPERTPLNPRITGKLDRDRYTIEKVIFESQPKYYVPANFYIPKNRKFPVPGIIFTCGHSTNGKAQNLYHETCLGLVLKGYAVLAYDPQGQGERSEYFDKNTKKNIIALTSSQHMYLGRTSFLVDWSLAGLRVWDGIRAIDYLASRPEVDKSKLGVVGNSGGGQMSFLIAAVDERIKVCVAAHPGGPYENAYLKGFGLGPQSLIDREILSLIAPRPCRVVVGWDSNEERIHRPKYDDMKLFYKGLGYEDRADFVLVHGVHNMMQPKREAAYEWFNKWFDKEEEGKAEPPLQPEKEKDLWCTESGFTLISLGGETGQTLNTKRMNSIYKPAKNAKTLKINVAKRIGLTIPVGKVNPEIKTKDKFTYKNLTVEKFTYESENGILIPSLLLKPDDISAGSPVYLYVSDRSKPEYFKDDGLPFLLAGKGYIVMAIDVRGIGETSMTAPVSLDQVGFHQDAPPNPLEHYVVQYVPDAAAIQSPGFGRTMLGMRTLDVMRGIDVIDSREDLKGRKIILAGEGSGGLWVLLSTVFDNRVYGVVTIGTLPSYKLLITKQYYNIWDYFWVPGVLRDFDISDVARLVSPKPQIWIDPVDELREKYNYTTVSPILRKIKNLQIVTPDKKPDGNLLQVFSTVFK